MEERREAAVGRLLLGVVGRFFPDVPFAPPFPYANGGGRTPNCPCFPLPANHNFLSCPSFASSKTAEWSFPMAKSTISSPP
jgi:hypothetical protein